jgi:hypothetical protein
MFNQATDSTGALLGEHLNTPIEDSAKSQRAHHQHFAEPRATLKINMGECVILDGGEL